MVAIHRATGVDRPAIWPICYRIVAAGEICTYAPTTSEAEAGASHRWMMHRLL